MAILVTGERAMYIRKTRDEWEVQGNYGYGHGFECVDTLNTRSEAKDSLKVYRENERGVFFKIVKKRVKI
jgi:hypothetical protein